MSRTRKDRPYWVLKSDPKMDRYATHDHIVVVYDVVGEEPIYRRVPNKDGWGYHEELWYTRKLYKRTPVQVPCTLDTPDKPRHTWRYSRSLTAPDRLEQKNCYWWLEYYPNVRSHKDFKQLTSGAVRSKVRQKLHEAVRDYGASTTDLDDWYDVDVFVDSKHINKGWWD